MKEMKQDRKTRYTQMVLQDSLIELMIIKPISKITIKELCEKADINRTTFYAHYTDQNDLLRKIEDETLLWAKEVITNLMGKTDKHETINILEGTLQYFIENNKHLQVLMSEQGDIDFQKQLFTLIYQLCGIDPASINHGNTAMKECYFIFVVNGGVGLIQHWLKNELTIPVKEMAEIIYNMAFLIR